MDVGDLDARDLLRVEGDDAQDVAFARVRHREPQLVRLRGIDREHVLRDAGHDRRRRPRGHVDRRDVRVALVADVQRLRVRRERDAMRLAPDLDADDLLQRDRIDDRRRVRHAVVHRDELAVRRHGHLVWHRADGDLGHEREFYRFSSTEILK